MDKSSQKNLQMLILLVVWRADGVREDGGYWEASIPKIIDFFTMKTWQIMHIILPDINSNVNVPRSWKYNLQKV